MTSINSKKIAIIGSVGVALALLVAPLSLVSASGGFGPSSCVQAISDQGEFVGMSGGCREGSDESTPEPTDTSAPTQPVTLAAVSVTCTDHDGYFINASWDGKAVEAIHRLQVRTNGDWFTVGEVTGYAQRSAIDPASVREALGESASTFAGQVRVDYEVNGVRSEPSNPIKFQFFQQFDADAIGCG
jgi:hypothetical protein